MKIEPCNKVLAALLSVILLQAVAIEANATPASEPGITVPALSEPVTPTVPALSTTAAAATYAAFSASDAAATAQARYARLHTTYGAFTAAIQQNLYLPGTKTLRAQRIRPFLDKSKPMVALTFDDGPSQYTDAIVATLSKYGARATFCVLGNRVKAQKERVRLIAASGSQVIGHSWDHADLTKLTAKKIKKELRRTNNAIARYTGVRPRLFRPPYGSINDEVRKVAKKTNLAMLTWSYDSRDWESLDSEKVYKGAKKIKADQIVLYHDIHETTAVAMQQVIPWLVEQGFQLVTVDELFYYKGIKVKAGQTYNDGIE
jgi:peptidoglycan/xylan/chitin deacetylase (PgdA/CDA1 family)